MLKRRILYWYKTLEFRRSTWKAKREIARAYRSKSAGIRVWTLGWSKHLRRLNIYAGAFLAVILSGWLVLQTVQFVSGRLRDRAPSQEETHAGQKDPVREQTAEPEPGRVPRAPRMADVPDSVALLLVDKKARMLHVMQPEEGRWTVVAEYPVALGENGGRKKAQGDKRTPEGVYFIVGRREKSELARRYGPLAYVLNYPNHEDRLAGRTGRGIWIHGTAPDSIPVSTRGCIELHNEHVSELSRRLGEGIGTPVVLVAEARTQSYRSLLQGLEVGKRRDEVVRRYRGLNDSLQRTVGEWAEAWESQNIGRYKSFYDTAGFKAQGLAWEGWRERKLRTFRIYDTIHVTVREICLTEWAESTAVVKFLQHYRSDALNVRNVKRLEFVRREDRWLIHRESTLPTGEYPL